MSTRSAHCWREGRIPPWWSARRYGAQTPCTAIQPIFTVAHQDIGGGMPHAPTLFRGCPGECRDPGPGALIRNSGPRKPEWTGSGSPSGRSRMSFQHSRPTWKPTAPADRLPVMEKSSGRGGIRSRIGPDDREPSARGNVWAPGMTFPALVAAFKTPTGSRSPKEGA